MLYSVTLVVVSLVVCVRHGVAGLKFSVLLVTV